MHLHKRWGILDIQYDITMTQLCQLYDNTFGICPGQSGIHREEWGEVIGAALVALFKTARVAAGVPRNITAV
jgi:hypothetical protein